MNKILLLITVLLANVYVVNAQLSVVFNGDTTEIWDSDFSWSCSGRFFPVINISQDTIYITERDTMLPAFCLCYFSVCTKLTDLDTGTYTASVKRQNHYVGSISFTIVNPPTKASQVAFYQSPCLGQSVDERGSIPTNILLLTNYPNPFNPNTIIRYQVPSKSHVVLAIYNLAGQKISTLVDEQKYAGSYDIDYNAMHLPSGVYVCRLFVSGITISSKMILVR